MDAPREPVNYDVKNYLAAEQNFLAWIRTGLSLMGFGFVVARFGVFLQQVRLAAPQITNGSYGVSIWSGTAMIVLGVAVNAFAAWRHVQLIREFNEGQANFRKPSTLGVAVALILAVVGLAMAIYLVSI